MMDERFGARAAELSGAAAALLGWRPDEFWRSTPAELARALEAPMARIEAPDGETMDALRKRFPDD
jgi:uncharacterized phage protein (TIGR02216 family)